MDKKKRKALKHRIEILKLILELLALISGIAVNIKAMLES